MNERKRQNASFAENYPLSLKSTLQWLWFEELLSPWLCPEAGAARLCSMGSGNMTPMSGVPGTVGNNYKHSQKSNLNVFLLICLHFQTNLDFLLHIVIDESLWVDEVVWWIEGDRVKGSTVHAAFVHLAPARFREHQTLNRRHKSLREEFAWEKARYKVTMRDKRCNYEGK